VNKVKFAKLKNLSREMAFVFIIKQDMMSFYTRLLTLTLKMHDILVSKLII
jgi:hypothetical protein